MILQTHATVDWNDTKNFQNNPYKIKTAERIQIKLQNEARGCVQLSSLIIANLKKGYLW